MKIVFIDDEINLLETIKEIFIEDFPEAQYFSDSEKAKEYILNGDNEIDLIVSDFKMPQVNGLEIVDSLRQSGKSYPVIIFSGFMDKFIIEKLSAFENVMTCEKPEFKTLDMMIKKVI